MHVYEVLLRPIVTEKSTGQVEESNKYTFEVALKANKRQVQEAVEKIFNVNVLDVRTMIVKGKQRRWGRNPYKTPNWKKAIVTLNEGDSITFFEGV
jgi:large subunit ribosomal protein L23